MVEKMTETRPSCGTNAGYQAHRVNGEDACPACLTAHAAHMQQWRGNPRPKGPVHGTRAAYERERRAFKAGTGPAPCEVCTVANRSR
jgi:hypothetical protein